MSWKEWKHGQRKHSEKNVKSSEDFREKSPFSFLDSPPFSYLNTPIGIPVIGAIRTYHLLLLAFFVLFIFTKSMFVGIMAGALILYIVGYEFYSGTKEGGLKNELKETLIAIGLAVGLWFGLGFALNTPTPINAIVSCSMLPSYERGDMVILQGADINTGYLRYEGSRTDMNSTATIRYGDYLFEVNGSMYSYCSYNDDKICQVFKNSPEKFFERHGPIVFEYGICERKDIKSQKSMGAICVKKTYFEGGQIAYDGGYDLIVYAPRQGEYHSLVGDIVHRARFAVNASDGIVYLTKGDNNPIYDFQIYGYPQAMGNEPVEPAQIKGKTILRLPFLGNFKLFITPNVLIATDKNAGCESHFTKQE